MKPPTRVKRVSWHICYLTLESHVVRLSATLITCMRRCRRVNNCHEVSVRGISLHMGSLHQLRGRQTCVWVRASVTSTCMQAKMARHCIPIWYNMSHFKILAEDRFPVVEIIFKGHSRSSAMIRFDTDYAYIRLVLDVLRQWTI